MKTREQISAGQMSVMFFSFMTGSSIVNIPGPLIGYAKNGAWISLLLSLAIGAVLLVCILSLYRKFPDLTFIEYSRATVGKWLTVLLAIPFISFQFHMTSGIVLDIGLFLNTSMLRQTPLYLFSLPIFFVVALTVRSGIETMARMFFVPMVVVLASITSILILSIPNYNLEALLPLMSDGFKPVLLGAYFSYGFPYAELVLMSMVFPHIRKNERIKIARPLFLALFLNAFYLIAVTLSTILVFGPMAAERMYSMFEVARTVDLLEVIQRIESLVGISLIMASFMKAAVTLFVLNMTFTKLLNLQDDRILVFPLALVCFLFSMNQIEYGQFFWINSVTVIHPVWATVSYVLPLLIVRTAAFFRRRPGPSL
ncbi:GerAB/ArcD/ProY family transporter [Cohnella sp. CFH 77786]|uniref:GerAB/ArcD/ProY family transporter n=1 Tax=Cohnella sp. CFH 77786 TaxID=2662265 RepID=UPI001C609D17|nr:endospore germination permease [Cohnella sp. CFH 77786]MBW5445323.1 GerAB/ArcD/ProY family transporter [Cohnella sp. CFH 77786]